MRHSPGAQASRIKLFRHVLVVGCARAPFTSRTSMPPQPPEELDGARPWRYHPLSTKLSRLAPHAGALLDLHHIRDLYTGSARQTFATRNRHIALQSPTYRPHRGAHSETRQQRHTEQSQASAVQFMTNNPTHR